MKKAFHTKAKAALRIRKAALAFGFILFLCCFYRQPLVVVKLFCNTFG